MVGLRGVADEPHFLRTGEEAALGLLDDEGGLAVCTDALRDAQLAGLLLATVRGVEPRAGSVAVLRDDDDATVLDCGDRGDLLVFPWLVHDAAARHRPHGRTGGVRLQPRRGAAGALGLGRAATSGWCKSRWPIARPGGPWP